MPMHKYNISEKKYLVLNILNRRENREVILNSTKMDKKTLDQRIILLIRHKTLKTLKYLFAQQEQKQSKFSNYLINN